MISKKKSIKFLKAKNTKRSSRSLKKIQPRKKGKSPDVVHISMDNIIPRTQKYVNYWADYTELCCIFSPDTEFSLGDAKNITHGNDQVLSDEMVDNIFSFLESRSYIFSHYWPFLFKRGPSRIMLRKKLNEKHKFYMSLLFSSNLNLFNRNFHEFSCKFEDISKALLQTYLPLKSQVLKTGAGNTADKDMVGRSLKDKMTFISRELRIDLDKRVLDSDQTSGDFHIDIIAWKKYHEKNKAPGTITIFGQCGCGKDWKDKQHKITQASLGRLFHFKDNVLSAMIVPQSLRNTSGGWEHPVDVCPILLLDRLSFITGLEKGMAEKLFKKFYKGTFHKIMAQAKVHF